MARLSGKVALVTGAAQGIGEAVARAFVAEGAAAVVVTDVRNEQAGRWRRRSDPRRPTADSTYVPRPIGRPPSTACWTFMAGSTSSSTMRV